DDRALIPLGQAGATHDGQCQARGETQTQQRSGEPEKRQNRGTCLTFFNTRQASEAGPVGSLSSVPHTWIVNKPTLLNRSNRLHDAFVEQARLVERHIVRGPLEPLQDLFGARSVSK